MSIAALLLAAGESTRMGSPKPLLSWEGGTLIEYQVRQLQEAGAHPIIAVLGHAADQVQPVVEPLGATVVTNERYREGRASSVRAGVGAVPPDTEAVVVLSVDQPRPGPLIKEVIEAHRAAKALITMPSFRGRRGHPTVFSGKLLAEMSRVTEENLGLREVVTRHSGDVMTVEVESPLAVADVNTPEEYQRVKELFARLGELAT